MLLQYSVSQTVTVGPLYAPPVDAQIAVGDKAAGKGVPRAKAWHICSFALSEPPVSGVLLRNVHVVFVFVV